MNVRNGAAAAAMFMLLPAVAVAQTNPSPPDATPPAPPTTTSTYQQPTPTPAYSGSERTSHWLASGFVGSNFANNANPASMDFGGSIGYLARDRYGVEFDAGFTPDFQLQSNFFGLGTKPQINSYMGNFVYAVPLGADHQWQPFVSAGAGAISLRSGLNTDSNAAALDQALNPDDTRFGGNFGGGVMGFAGNWGFRANVQYYRATGSYNTSFTGTPGVPAPAPGAGGGGYVTTSGLPAASTVGANGQTLPRPVNETSNGLASAALSGLHFWRANVGVAVRW